MALIGLLRIPHANVDIRIIVGVPVAAQSYKYSISSKK